MSEAKALEKWVRFAKKVGLPLTFQQNQFLFYEGHSAFGAFFLLEGKVRLKIRMKSGREKLMGHALTGEFVGLQESIEDTPYLSSAYSLLSCRVIFVARHQILDEAKRLAAEVCP